MTELSSARLVLQDGVERPPTQRVLSGGGTSLKLVESGNVIETKTSDGTGGESADTPVTR